MPFSSEYLGSTLLVIVALSVVFFAAAAVALGYYLVFGENLAGLPQNLYTLSLSEYVIESSPEPIIVEVGKPVVFKIVNEGTVKHEVMFVPNLEMMAEMISSMAMKLQRENPDLSQEEIIEQIDKLHDTMMEEMIEEAMKGKAIGEEFMIELEPGESRVTTYTFLEPGIYVIACLELTGTFPEAHAQEGMFNQIIVVEG